MQNHRIAEVHKQRPAVLSVLWNIVQNNIEVLTVGEQITLMVLQPKIRGLHLADFGLGHADLSQLQQRFAQHAGIALVQADSRVDREAASNAHLHHIQRVLLRARHAAHPVVPAANTIKADAEFRLQPAFVKHIQKRFIHEPGVGVNDVNVDLFLAKPIDNLPEILANERLTARQVDAQHTALRHLVHNVHGFVGGQLMPFAVRRIEKTMPALKIAFPCKGPHN